MKLFAVLISAILLIGMLAACSADETVPSNDASDPQPKASNEQSSQPPVSSIPETADLKIATPAGHSVENFDERFGNRIREKFPNYKITYVPSSEVSFENITVTNTMIDIVYAAILDFGRGPLQYGMVYDMTDLIRQHDVDLDKISVDWYGGLGNMWNGNIYALPISLESNALFYNKDLFDHFGVDYPGEGITWDEVFDLNVRLTRTEENTNYVGISFALAQHFSLNSLSIPYVDQETEQATLSKYENEWKTLYETIAIRPLEAPGYSEKIAALNRLPHQTEFLQGEAAMFAGLVHSPLSWAEMQDLNWDLTNYPIYAERPNTGAQGNLLLFGITNMSEQKNAAMEVIKYLLSEEFQVITSADGNIPILLNDETISAFAKNTYFGDRNVQSIFSVPFAPLSPRTALDPVTPGLYRSKIVQLARGEMDVNTMMRQLEQEINLELEAAKKQQ